MGKRRTLGLGLLGALFGLAASALVGCGGQSPPVRMDPDDELVLSRRALERQKYADAIVQFQDLVFNYPGSPEAEEAQFLLGECYLKTEQYELAREAFQNLIQDYPESQFRDDAQLYIGVTYLEESLPAQYDQEMTWRAIEEFEVFLADYPTSPLRDEAEAHLRGARDKIAEKGYLNGRLYLKMGYTRAARLTFERVTQEFPVSPWAARSMLGIARAHIQEKNHREAEETLGRLIEEYAGTPEAEIGRKTLEELEDTPSPRG